MLTGKVDQRAKKTVAAHAARPYTQHDFRTKKGFHSRIGVDRVATRGREGRIQNRRYADNDHVARKVDRFFPVRNDSVVTTGTKPTVPSLCRSVHKIVATDAQVNVHEALTLRGSLPLIYELRWQGAFGDKLQRVPNTGVRDDRPVAVAARTATVCRKGKRDGM